MQAKIKEEEMQVNQHFKLKYKLKMDTYMAQVWIDTLLIVIYNDSGSSS